MKRLAVVVLAVLIATSVGCATPPVKREAAVFFPPAPDPPRIQFLTSFSSQRDIEKESAFRRLVFGAAPGLKMDRPYGVAIFDGKIYVCDTTQSVFVLDLRNRTFKSLKGASGKGRLLQPLNISIEPDGTKYVTDPVRGQVVAFDAKDEFLKAYGTPGSWKPVDAVARGGNLYVVDIQHGAVQVFDKSTGEILRTIGTTGEPGQRLHLPTNIAFDREGRLHVSDVGKFQILTYDPDGRYLGVTGKLGNNLGHFARPRGVAIDRDDRLYAVDASFNNVQIFNSQNQLLLFFGAGGRGPGGLRLPAKVVVDYDNLAFFKQYAEPGFDLEYLVIVTSQTGERLVNVYGYGRQKDVTYPSDATLLKQRLEKSVQQSLEPEKPGEPSGYDPEKSGP